MQRSSVFLFVQGGCLQVFAPPDSAKADEIFGLLSSLLPKASTNPGPLMGGGRGEAATTH